MDRLILPPSSCLHSLQHTPPTATNSSIFSVFHQFSESQNPISPSLSFWAFFSLSCTTHSFLINSGSRPCFPPLILLLFVLVCGCQSAHTQPLFLWPLYRIKQLQCCCVWRTSGRSLLTRNHKHMGAYLSTAALINIITNYPVSSHAHMNSYCNKNLKRKWISIKYSLNMLFSCADRC